ncbi:sulfotransferase 6B1 isoform X2 [Callorhinchus milii]|uniref:sulfotransferase 6B1 isoform X2 n=1 Tax=Callorhinchus milii TaxID=7868 RepID=UPI001C3FEB11|nr:sulfotransferase 6B1 isoform X2 [Callorhinchus milii]
MASAEQISFQDRARSLAERAQSMAPEELLFRYRGQLYPSLLSSEQTLARLGTFQARTDDLLLSVYPKCGFNWVFQLVKNIVNVNEKESGEEKHESKTHFPLLEFGGPEKFEILVVLRNPKDTAVSYFHFCQNNPLLPTFPSWDEFYKKYMTGEVPWGSYFDHALLWNKHIDDENVMVITFEELKENLIEGVKKVAKHFGYSLNEEQVQKVSSKADFKVMSENSQKTHGNLGKIFFRKGVVGDWKNLFTDKQSEEMDAKFEECLAGTKLGAELKYNIYCKD